MDLSPRSLRANGDSEERTPRPGAYRLVLGRLVLGPSVLGCLSACCLTACGTLLGLDEHRIAPLADSAELGACTEAALGCELPPDAACTSPPCVSDAGVVQPGAAETEQGPMEDRLAPAGGVQALGDAMACLSQSREMELRPLALYLMLDSSGSMEEPSGESLTKWDSVVRAIRGFLAEARESDLQLGMQFFPLLKPGASFTCTTHEDCGPEGGPCYLSTCLNGEEIQLCRTDADCPGGPGINPCVPFGLCSGSDPAAPIACVLPSTCAGGLGTCQDFERTCTNVTSCDPLAYATPAVEISPVAQVVSPIDQALTAKVPGGLTPTVPALRGTLDHARAWALAHPTHTVAALLATDGLPTECGSQDPVSSNETINQVISIAREGVALAPSLRTFVIGVFQPGDQASINNVNAIAAAGGTVQSALVDSSGEVEREFLEALRAVRDAAAPCRLSLTSSPELDYSRVNVDVDAGDGVRTRLPHVGGLAGCAAEQAGWYYYAPADGSAPSLELCPSICQVLKSTPSAGLQLQVGCAQ